MRTIYDNSNSSGKSWGWIGHRVPLRPDGVGIGYMSFSIARRRAEGAIQSVFAMTSSSIRSTPLWIARTVAAINKREQLPNGTSAERQKPGGQSGFCQPGRLSQR